MASSTSAARGPGRCRAAYVSQYFHYGHYGVDIADDYGSSIVSPRAGTVVFAGWKSNGGGYQVWINHGNGIYSAHHHMSSVVVSSGQSVAKGQRIGRVGSSGWATGPHDHFEVWIGGRTRAARTGSTRSGITEPAAQRVLTRPPAALATHNPRTERPQRFSSASGGTTRRCVHVRPTRHPLHRADPTFGPPPVRR